MDEIDKENILKELYQSFGYKNPVNCRANGKYSNLQYSMVITILTRLGASTNSFLQKGYRRPIVWLDYIGGEFAIVEKILTTEHIDSKCSFSNFIRAAHIKGLI